ncbi:MAG: aminofutalosine synthase MqnE [Planctomycetota bacterium]|jgi:aminodeoxyfutalosine synthase
MTTPTTSAIADIAAKVDAGERLTREEGERLFAHPNLLEVGALANSVRERLHGDKTFYVVNRHLNYSNVCTLSCKFCAFYRRDGDDGAYTWPVEQMLVRAEDMVEAGATEIHIVGGLHPELPFEYYTEMLSGLKTKFPGIHLKGFTANEIWHFAGKFGMSYAEVFRALKAAGLDSLPGGGAEIFDEAVRSKICPGKEPAAEWLEIHKTAHEAGLKSTATMLYGHIETDAQRVDHMIRLRELQDQTGGLTCFIPLSFHPANTQMEEIQQAGGTTDLRIVAVARLMLDNIPHIKTYWIMTGVKTAQIALQFGADDLDGTVIEEKITHMAGGRSPEYMSERELCRLIREAGRVPVRRDSVYNEFDAPADPALATA